MTKEYQIKLAIEKGYTCNPETGIVNLKSGIEATTTDDKGYVMFSIKHNNKPYWIRCHRFIFYVKNGYLPNCIDHIDGNIKNNKISNLRDVTQQKNMFNRKNTKGYSYCKKSGKYRAQIRVNKKIIHLGRYDTEQEAHKSYLDAKKIYHKI